MQAQSKLAASQLNSSEPQWPFGNRSTTRQPPHLRQLAAQVHESVGPCLNTRARGCVMSSRSVSDSGTLGIRTLFG